MKKIIMATVASVLLIGCGDSAPKCNDNDVVDLVLDIHKQKIKEKVTSTPGYESLKTNYLEMKENGTLDSGSFNSKMIKMGYEKLEAILAAADKMKLISIQTEMSDDKTKKSSCKAQLQFEDKSRPISYTVQRTDEGKLSAEVSDFIK